MAGLELQAREPFGQPKAARATGHGGRSAVRAPGALLTLRCTGSSVRALVVHALDKPAAGFPAHLGFKPNAANPPRLEIPRTDLEPLIADQIRG